MDLIDQMKTFVRIVDAGHLSAAAKGLDLSAAAVSRQLGALEHELGATLVVRSTRRLAVTEAGQRWYDHCTRILAELDTARADVAEGETIRGRVVISAPASLSAAYLAPRCAQLSRLHPELRLDLRPDDQTVDLVGEGVDIAVRAAAAPPDSTSIIAHKLASFRRVVVASPAYLRKHGTPKHPNDLVHHALLVQTRAFASFTRWQFQRGEESVEVRPVSRLGSSSPVILREWARAGAGITLLPSWFVADLKPLLVAWQTPHVDVHALHRTEVRSAPRIRAVIAAIVDEFARRAD